MPSVCLFCLRPCIPRLDRKIKRLNTNLRHGYCELSLCDWGDWSGLINVHLVFSSTIHTPQSFAGTMWGTVFQRPRVLAFQFMSRFPPPELSTCELGPGGGTAADDGKYQAINYQFFVTNHFHSFMYSILIPHVSPQSCQSGSLHMSIVNRILNLRSF